MTNPIHQWLEENEKPGSEINYEETNKASGYNEAVADFKAALPSLLSAMEAEIRSRTPKVEDYLKHDQGSPLRISYVDGAMEAEKRIHTIIHEYFNHIRG